MTASKHVGETITIQYGVYWCKTSSGSRGEGQGGPCAPDLTPADFSETLIFEEKQLLVRNTTFESPHRGVSCGRIQIDIGGLGGILGGDTYDTGVSCGEQPPPPPPGGSTPTPIPPGEEPTIPSTVTEDQQALLDIAMSLFTDLLEGNFTNQPDDGSGGGPAPTLGTGTRLDYTIPFRDTSVRPADNAKERVAQTWPNAKMAYWEHIIKASVDNGWNPAFVLTLWIEETGGSTTVLASNGGAGVCRGACSLGHLGCAPRQNQTIDQSLSCLFNNFSQFTNEQFAQFMQRYSGEVELGVFINNPNFVKNVKIWYSNLAPQ